MDTLESIKPFLGPIKELVLDDAIDQVLVNGPECIFVQRNGQMREVQGLTLEPGSLLETVQNIAAFFGTDLSPSKPILNLRSTDGVSIAAVIPPYSCSCVALTICKSRLPAFDASSMIYSGLLDPTTAKRLEEYVCARKNILVSGPSGTGKGVVLSMLASFVAEHERIVVVEEGDETRILNRNTLRLRVNRTEEGAGPITVADLIRAVTSHRPDRIVLGSIRGREAFDLMELSGLGYCGIMASIHALSANGALSRFTGCALQGGADEHYRALKHRIAEFVNVIVQIDRRPGGQRILEICEVNGYDPEADFFQTRAFYPNLRSTAEIRARRAQ